jgi:Pyridoxamine 5'-phosphate oxidase
VSQVLLATVLPAVESSFSPEEKQHVVQENQGFTRERGKHARSTQGNRDRHDRRGARGLSAHPARPRVATTGPGGHPLNGALWFVWDGTALWLNSPTCSQRWSELDRDPRVGVLVDDGGIDLLRLRGVELTGSAEGRRPARARR